MQPQAGERSLREKYAPASPYLVPANFLSLSFREPPAEPESWNFGMWISEPVSQPEGLELFSSLADTLRVGALLSTVDVLELLEAVIEFEQQPTRKGRLRITARRDAEFSFDPEGF